MTGRLTGISSMATRALLAELAARHEAASGTAVAIESVGGVEAARRIRAGEQVDVVVLASGVMERLEAEGHLVRGSRVALALSPMAAVVPAGRPKPDLSTGEAVRRAMLSARSIGFSTGPSGDHLKRLGQEWGIADALASRLVQAPPGVPVGTLVARGDAVLGFQQLSELLGVDGVEVAGRLPAELGTDTIFAAGVAATCTRTDEAAAFIAFAASDAAADAKLRIGMEPAPAA